MKKDKAVRTALSNSHLSKS